MQQAVQSIQIDEHTEIGDILHNPLADLPLDNRRQQFPLLHAHPLLNQVTARKDDITAILVDLDHLEFKLVINQRVHIVHRADVHLRTWQECIHTIDVHDHAALDPCLDHTHDGAAFRAGLDHVFPLDLLLGLFLAQDDHATFVFHLVEKHIELVADLDDGDILELMPVDHAFGLVADVDQHFIILDGQDPAWND